MYRGQKRYAPTKGVDLKSSDILRSSDFLSGGENVRYDAQNNLIKRPGFQLRKGNALGAGNGLYPFTTTNYLGQTKTELIYLANKPYRVVKATITITNSHASDALTVFIGEDSGYRLKLTLGSVVVYNATIDPTGGADTIAAKVAAIDALASIACTSSSTTYDTTHFAYSLDLQVNEVISVSSSRTINWYYLEAVNQYVSETVNPEIDNARSYSDYEITSAVTLNNCLYVAFRNKTIAYNSLPYVYDIFSGISKYDGQTYYRAGAPTPNKLDLTTTGAGAVTDTRGAFNVAAAAAIVAWKYRASIVAIDKAGNVIESGVGVEATLEIPAGVAAVLRLDISPNTSASNTMKGAGYNNHIAFSSSAMGGTSLTLPVDNGAGGDHSLQVGDVACFWDANQNRTISRIVESRTASQIVVSGSSIDREDQGGSVRLLDNATISNNVRIAIWRTKGTSGSFYLVRELPFNVTDSYTSSVILYDNYADSQLGAILVESEKIAGIPPFCTNLSTFNGRLVASGATKEPNSLWFSELDNVENFPPAQNSVILPSRVTAHAESGGILNIFGEEEIHALTGDLESSGFRIDQVASTIGCVAHQSVKKVSEGEVFFLSKRGPMRLVNGRQIAPLGAWQDGVTSRLEPYFTATYPSFDSSGRYLYKPKFSMATAAIDPQEKLYILCIPWTTDFKPHYVSPYPLDHAYSQDIGYTASQTPSVSRCMSETWVYDYGKDCWLPKWKDVDFSSGITYYDGTIWGCTVGSNTHIFTMNKNKAGYTYQDYGVVDSYPVSSFLTTNWESLGEPDLWKNFLWLTLSSVGTRDSSTFSVDLTTYPNYDTALVAHTSATMEFVAKLWKRVKLKSAKMNSIQLKFANSDVNETFAISGWELAWNSQHEYPASASGGTQG